MPPLPIIRPVTSSKISELMDLLNSQRYDLRTQALRRLLSARSVPARHVNERLRTAGLQTRLLLYEVAAVHGDAESLAIMLSQYDRSQPTRYESIRLMECILQIGERHPLPADFLPFLTRAWLEGDLVFTALAGSALRTMGKEAVPELTSLLFGDDSARTYAALSLLLETGGTELDILRRLIARGESYSSDALDVAVLTSGKGPETAEAVFANGELPDSLRAHALWWMLVLGMKPDAQKVIALADSYSLAAARAAGLALQAYFPELWSNGKWTVEPITPEVARILTGLANHEAAAALQQAECTPEAAEVRTRFLKSNFDPAIYGGETIGMLLAVRFKSFRSAVSEKLADYAKRMVKAGKTEDAARLLSTALGFSWERAAADTLAELLAYNPSIPAGLYLDPLDAQLSTAPLQVSRFHLDFAAALRGDTAGWARAVSRPIAESMFSLGDAPFTERLVW